MALIALSAQAYKDLILTVLGNSEAAQLTVDPFWAMHSLRYGTDYAIYLHTQRAIIGLELGNLEQELKYPIEGERQQQVNTRLAALRLLLAMTDAEIRALDTTYPALVGVLTQTVPRPAAAWAADASDPAYSGDAVNRWPSWWGGEIP